MPLEILRAGKLGLNPIINTRSIIVLSLVSRQGRVYQRKRLQQHSARHLRVLFRTLAKHARERIGYDIVAPTDVLDLEFKLGKAQNPYANTAYILGFSQ
jgi:hypothetical protein